MRLYVNSHGQWVGTQAEAKKINAILVDVPVSKPELIAFLNREQVCRSTATHGAAAVTPDNPDLDPVVHKSLITHAHAWQTIRECAERAPLKDFPVAIAVYQNRINDIV